MSRMNLKQIINLLLGGKDKALLEPEFIQSTDQETIKTAAPEPKAKQSKNAKSQKIILLKKAFDFDGGVAEKARSSETIKSFLLCLHQEFFCRVETLHDIGVVNEQSYGFFKIIVSKSEELLSQTGNLHQNNDDLASENESLKRQLSTLYKKHVKSDIICENELVLEEEKSRLRSRLDALTERYKLSQKANSDLVARIEKLEKIEAQHKLLSAKYLTQQKLVSNVESSTENSADLELKIRHLTAKVEHQDRLISALSYENPSNANNLIQDMVAENDKIRKEINKDDDEIENCIKIVSQKWPEKSFLTEQLEEISKIYAAYEFSNTQIQESECIKQTNQPSDILDCLQNDAETLKSIESIKTKVREFIITAVKQESASNSLNFEKFAELINQEKDTLQQALERKQKYLESLNLNGETRCLTEKISRLISQDNRLSDLVDKQNKIIANLRSDRKRYQVDIGKLKEAVKNNRRLSLEIAKNQIEIKNAKKTQDELLVAKKTCYSLQATINKQSNYLKILEENVVKLEFQNSKLSKENIDLVAQYDRLFNND